MRRDDVVIATKVYSPMTKALDLIRQHAKPLQPAAVAALSLKLDESEMARLVAPYVSHAVSGHT